MNRRLYNLISPPTDRWWSASWLHSNICLEAAQRKLLSSARHFPIGTSQRRLGWAAIPHAAAADVYQVTINNHQNHNAYNSSNSFDFWSFMEIISLLFFKNPSNIKLSGKI